MKLTKSQKEELISLFNEVDVKEMEVDGIDEEKTKWFRFGSYNGLVVATKLIEAIQEPTKRNPNRQRDSN